MLCWLYFIFFWYNPYFDFYFHHHLLPLCSLPPFSCPHNHHTFILTVWFYYYLFSISSDDDFFLAFCCSNAAMYPSYPHFIVSVYESLSRAEVGAEGILSKTIFCVWKFPIHCSLLSISGTIRALFVSSSTVVINKNRKIVPITFTFLNALGWHLDPFRFRAIGLFSSGLLWDK